MALNLAGYVAGGNPSGEADGSPATRICGERRSSSGAPLHRRWSSWWRSASNPQEAGLAERAQRRYQKGYRGRAAIRFGCQLRCAGRVVPTAMKAGVSMTGDTKTDGFSKEALEAPAARARPGDAAGPPETAGARADPPDGMAAAELDALHVYLRAVQRRPPISADRARCCGRAMHDAEEATAPEGERSGRAQEAVRANRDEIVEGNLGLVVRIARQYEHLGVPSRTSSRRGTWGCWRRRTDSTRTGACRSRHTPSVGSGRRFAAGSRSRAGRSEFPSRCWVSAAGRPASCPTWSRRPTTDAAARATMRSRRWRIARTKSASRRTACGSRCGGSRMWIPSMLRPVREGGRSFRRLRTPGSRTRWTPPPSRSGDRSLRQQSRRYQGACAT